MKAAREAEAAMMMDLFGAEDRHQAGGKGSHSLPAGIKGDAEFCGPRDCYRPMLRRWMGDEFPKEFLMMIGMNPSSASHEKNDNTITREWGFTTREGFKGLAKFNISDYRATFPKDFLTIQVPVSSARNIPLIREYAANASKIIVCHGKLIKPLKPAGKEIVEILKRDGRKLYCFGFNADLSPKHPLYLKAEAELVDF